MSIEQVLQKSLAANKNIHQVNQNELKQEKAQSDGLNVPDIAIFFTPVSFIFSWIFFFLILQKIRTFLDNKIVFTVKDLHQVPCKNCRFYSNNHYLKCAVQPSIVLTIEAINCSEYSPQKVKFSFKNIFK
jgi:hypothetical protein